VKESSIMARLVKLRDDLDLIVEAATERAKGYSADRDEGFEEALRAKGWSSVRNHIEEAIMEMELWE